MLAHVTITNQDAILEIGCGDGFLTRHLVQTPAEKVLVIEIDKHWAHQVRLLVSSEKLEIINGDVLEILDHQLLGEHKWLILANLPYNITFPIFTKFVALKKHVREGVVMIQEEVAQKLASSGGRSLGYVSLFFQYHFEFKLCQKVPPSAFVPAPRVISRLLYFKPRIQREIPDEEAFWQFLKKCFSQPRRTLKNNLASLHFNHTIPDKFSGLRAQQMSMEDFLELWAALRG